GTVDVHPTGAVAAPDADDPVHHDQRPHQFGEADRSPVHSHQGRPVQRQQADPLLDLGDGILLLRPADSRCPDRHRSRRHGTDRGASVPWPRKADTLPLSMVASTSRPATSRSLVLPSLDAIGAWVLALVWIAPLVFAVWAAFHTPRAALAFDISAPLTFDNFVAAWRAAPWPRF